MGQLASQSALRRANRWIVVALIVATVLAYVPALSAPFVMDDADTISASSQWMSPVGSPTAGRPLVLATLAANFAVNRALRIDQRLDPDGPYKAIGYRIFNLTLHLMTGAVLFGVLRRAMREHHVAKDWRALADPVAGSVCALWLLHPIQSEVINYIVQRSEALASFCYLAMLYASIRAWDAVANVRARWYIAGVVACIGGMLSKEIMISAPLAVMLYDRAFRVGSWRALMRPDKQRRWFYIVLWTVSVATFAAVERGARGETAGFAGPIPWYEYLYTQCWAIAHYLRLVFWPSAFAIDYGFQPIHGLQGVPGAFLLVVIGVATLAAWTRVRHCGWFAFLGSVFLTVLAPSSSIVPITTEVAAERRMYLALAPVLVFATVVTVWLWRRASEHFSPERLGVGAAIVASALALTSAARSRTYASSEALWRSAVRATPNNPRALSNFGWALYKLPEPKLAEADSMLARATRLDTTCQVACIQYAMVLTREGHFNDAEKLLERELTGADASHSAVAERTLGLVLMKLGAYDRAIPHLEITVARFPTVDHLVVLGVAYFSAGHVEQAIATFRRVAAAGGGTAAMRRFSSTLGEASLHRESLQALQDLAWRLAHDWI